MSKILGWVSTAALLTSSLVLAASIPQSTTGVVAKVKQAYSDLTLARNLLRTGRSTTKAQGLLSKAESNLNAARSVLPSSALLSKVDEAQSQIRKDANASVSPASGASGLLGDLQSDAAKVDPKVASKLEQARQHVQDGNASQASSQLDEAKQKLKMNPSETAYEKVVAARTLLDAGKTSSAKSTLASVPSFSSVKSSLMKELSGVGGSGSTGVTAP